VLLAASAVVDEGHVEAQLAGVLGLEGADLELDDDVPQLLDVEQQQVEDVLVAVDVEPDLPVDEREPGAELPQGLDEAVHQRLLEVAFGDLLAQLEEVEDVRVLGDLLRELGVRRRQGRAEVGRRRAQPRVRAGHDLVLQDVARPAVLGRGCGVPVPLGAVVEPGQDQHHVAPGKLSHSL
jgi:hypothetical protein